MHVHVHLNRSEKGRDRLGWLHVSARSQPVLSLIESSTATERPDDALEPRRRDHQIFLSHSLSLPPLILSHTLSYRGEQSVSESVRQTVSQSDSQSILLGQAESLTRPRPLSFAVIIIYDHPRAAPSFPLVSCMAFTRRCTHSWQLTSSYLLTPPGEAATQLSSTAQLSSMLKPKKKGMLTRSPV